VYVHAPTGDFIGFDTYSNEVGVFTASGFLRFAFGVPAGPGQSYGFDNPVDVYPSFNGCG